MSDRCLVAIDTAGSRALVALGTMDGTLLAEERWEAGFRHGEELLVRLQSLLRARGVGLADLGAIVVGTGPGAFTGLRVGLATAKALASGLGVPLVGVATSAALLDAALAAGAAAPGRDGLSDVPRSHLALLLPAGPSDRVLVTATGPTLVRGGEEPRADDALLVAVDLGGRADPDALDRGRAAEAGLAASLVRLGAERLKTAGGDAIARLVPEYVTLPRGGQAASGEVQWSRGNR